MFKFLKYLKSPQVYILPILASWATYYCLQNGYKLDMPVVASVFFIGIFFCFGVVLNAADERRFKVFDEIAIIKANIMSFWQIVLAQNIGKKNEELILRKLMNVQRSMADFLLEMDEKKSETKLKAVDKQMKGLEDSSEILRKKGFKSPEVSRLHQYMAQIYWAFEKLLMIKEHRTPRVIRYFLRFALIISVFILAPEFATLGYFGVFTAGVVAFLLASLIEIQRMIEYPFDQDLDDIRFRFLERFEERVGSIE